MPARLRSPLVTGTNALADRITCTVLPQTVTVGPKAPKAPEPPNPHDEHGHGHGDGNGNGNDK